MEQISSRPIAEFPPEIWENSLSSFTFEPSVYESYAKRIDTLKDEVKGRLMDGSTGDLIDNIRLIDTLCRLGISHHFQAEIEDKLNEMLGVNGLDQGIATILQCYDLCTVALVFQALRQYGYKLPCDVFKKFKNKDGKFEETLTGDARGMLSLHEAAQWATHGEEILDEALEFTKAHLSSLATQASPHLAKRIQNSLLRPYHRGMPKLEARQYIEYYELEVDIRNDALLELAKLDFNFCQLMHRQELKNILRWLKDSNLEKQLPYARSRPVEIFFWVTGICYEPQYSMARTLLTKAVTFLSYFDDTYDVYGTVEELNSLTDSIQAYPNSEIELPDYMKRLYENIRNFLDEAERELAKEGRSGYVSYAVEEYKVLTKSYLQERLWMNTHYVPTIEEYMKDSMITSTYSVFMAILFMAMKEAKLDVFEWLSKRPPILRASEKIGRLMNDIVSHKFEQQRDHAPSSVECYMKQYGASEEHAIGEIKKWIKEAWKDMNEELLRPNSVPVHILIRFFNNARSTDVFYAQYDGYTNPDVLQNAIMLTLFEQIPV